MTKLERTTASGKRFEDTIVSSISRYTNLIWRNIRIETLLTKKGNTEVDILFCMKNVIFIVEAKNVSSIIGEYHEKWWYFIGYKSAMPSSKYKHLNSFVQNNIHVRSFKDVFFSYYNVWPQVVPAVVVPDGCIIDDSLRGIVFTLNEFDRFLSVVNTWDVNAKIQRRVAALIACDGATIERPDFIYDKSKNKRVKRAVRK